MPSAALTPLLADDSPLDPERRALVSDLFARERRLMDALPTDDPLDAKRRRRVELTRVEIAGQAQAVRETLAAGQEPARRAAAALAAAGLKRIVMTGCGDSLAVMIAARQLFEGLLGVACEPIQALDFAYYASETLGPDTLVIMLSSSGTTTRTVEAALIAKARGAHTLSLSNTAGSALMIESDHGLPVVAERKGWPTQASTAALALLLQFGLDLAAAMGRHPDRVAQLQAALDAVPDRMAALTDACEATVTALAKAAASRKVFLFAGGGPSFATALFGAAKVKECSPDHAIAIQLEEFHHYNSQKAGDPLWLIAPDGPSVARARDTAFEGKRWGGEVIAVVTGDEDALDAYAGTVLRLPAVPEPLSVLLTSVPVQLFAYHLAMAKFAAADAATA